MNEKRDRTILIIYAITVLAWGLSMFIPNYTLAENNINVVAYGAFTLYATGVLICCILKTYTRELVFFTVNGTIAMLGIAYVIRGFGMDDYLPLIEGLTLLLLSILMIIFVIMDQDSRGPYEICWGAFLVMGAIVTLALCVSIADLAGHIGESYIADADFLAALTLLVVTVYSTALVWMYLQPSYLKIL